MQLIGAIRDGCRDINAVRQLSSQIEAEYMEMPGLSVTLPQAQRLWTADRHTCQTAFNLLIARGVLKMSVKGRFIRA
jgi:hypothetical protein